MATAPEKKKTEPPKLLDADALIDEILAKKGPQKYKDGLSEDKWEEVHSYIVFAACRTC